MIQIRRKTFETNSSSTHSASLCNSSHSCVNDITVEVDGYVHVSLGEFGWEYESYDTSSEKLTYLITYLCQQQGLTCYYSNTDFGIKMKKLYELEDFIDIIECVKANVECKGIFINSLEGYVDHQSIVGNNLSEYLAYHGVSSIQDYIFGGVVVTTDNDNH